MFNSINITKIKELTIPSCKKVFNWIQNEMYLQSKACLYLGRSGGHFFLFLFIWRKEPFIGENADVAIALSIVIMMVLFGIYICAGSGSSRRGGPSYSNIDKGKFGGQNNICISTKLVFISKRLQQEKNGLKLLFSSSICLQR